MKKLEAPKLEVVRFEEQDVITASGEYNRGKSATAMGNIPLNDLTQSAGKAVAASKTIFYTPMAEKYAWYNPQKDIIDSLSVFPADDTQNEKG